MSGYNEIDIAALRAALVGRASQVAIAILGKPNLSLCSKRELRFGNRGSLAVAINGPKVGLWYDHENGEGGDLLDLLRRKRGSSFSDAVLFAREIIGSAPQRHVCSPRPVSNRIASGDNSYADDRVLQLWNQAGPINQTSAATYLHWRGVLGPALETGQDVMRFHCGCPFGNGQRHPCLLALMRNIQSNKPCALQRTALPPSLIREISRITFAEFTHARRKVTRMTLGATRGAAIKLSNDEDVTERLAIGEGLETVPAAMQLGFRPVWAVGGTAGIKSFPVLSGIEALTILVDNDGSGSGQRVAQQCSERWTDAGREVFYATPNHVGDDFNDVLSWSLCA